MKYHYPFIKSHKSIKQGYIGSSKIPKETTHFTSQMAWLQGYQTIYDSGKL